MREQLIAAATESVRERGTDAALVDVATALVPGYVAAADPEELPALDPADVAGAVLAQLTLREGRTRGAAEVRVSNPTRAVDGWESRHTVVQVVTDDMPFLVDSISTAVVERGYDVHLSWHPVVDGESLVHLEIDRETDSAVLASLRDEVAGALADVRAAVADWAAMRDRALDLARGLRRRPPPSVDAADVAEAVTFLEWLADDHFTFLGCVEYELLPGEGPDALRLVQGSQLGLVRRRPLAPASVTFGRMAPELRHLAYEPYVLTLTKAQARSTVHRPVPFDYVGVKRFDDAGNVVGECRFTGLYTANVYSEATADVPVLRRKVAYVLARAALDPRSHDGRTLEHVLETFPRDELFRLSRDELFVVASGILRMGERRRLHLFVLPDEYGRFVSCLVYLPRDRYTTMARVQILDALRDAFGDPDDPGVDVDFQVSVTESVLARLHIVVSTPAGARRPDVVALEARLGGMARQWVDDLRDALVAAHGEETGLDTYREWADAFPPGYQFEVAATAAVDDIAVLEGLDPAGDLAVRLHTTNGGAPGEPMRAELYRSGGALVLSDVMPLLEQLGVTVLDERPYEVRPASGPTRWILSFGVRTDPRDPVPDADAQARVAELFLGVWAGEIENDGLNRLVLRAGLSPRDVVIVRTYAKYLRQAGLRFTDAYLADVLSGNPEAVRHFVALFHERFDPARGDAAEIASIEAELGAAIDAVVSLDEDRILRALATVLHATVRTNAYQSAVPGDGGDSAAARPKPYVACKLDAAQIELLPAPRPAHEIWVYSPRVEAVHLRSGDIARGGIRWSDRREDFRWEVLGLMKAQTVKNSVIVPVGAKGGFVVKRPPADDRAAVQAEVLECYRTFIRGMLDVTDNLVDGVVVAPPRVVRDDGDDPYLVVAADKGTASVSDVANGLAAEYGFWLGDAFASGGSAGFDHKEMGITSRGAWISVKAHFRALGIDADTAPLTLVGIGDMSGDVFGNGLLRSPHVKLLAAFDHRHVFVDPDPDPAVSFAERQRLFELPASSWADYDPVLLSRGGAVFERSAKSVTLSAEACAVLGIAERTLAPDALVSAVLRAPVDLLWNGGIGTYVKASTESHADVNDRTNDATRVDAGELRAKVVGEGGNLGFTQRARVEYALAGGRINTDAIDNSAGVDCSDHEVNIKILLQAAIRRGTLAPGDRDALLASMTDDVAALVLADNEAQANALEIAAVEAASLVGVHARQIERLEQTAHLDRALEFLPTPRQLQERHAAGLGLTAPELAVLLAYTKLELERALVASDVPDDPALHRLLVEYFPPVLRDETRFPVAEHALRREITATVVANAVVNRAGISFLSRLGDETGESLADLTRAHLAAREIFATATVWDAVDALDLRVPAAVQDAMFLSLRRLVERAARWVVRHGGAPDLGAVIERLRPGVGQVVAALPRVITGPAARRLDTRAEEYERAGVPAELATRVAAGEWALGALPATALAAEHGTDPVVVARLAFVVAERLELDRLLEHIAALPRGDRWQTEARAALRDEFHDSHEQLTAAVLSTAPAMTADDVAGRVETWLGEHREAVDRYRQVVDDVEAAGVFDLATLAVARRALRELTTP
ncbi:MAG: NAD-glutamate dehydrogenase [Acidimicrobiia bacterium]